MDGISRISGSKQESLTSPDGPYTTGFMEPIMSEHSTLLRLCSKCQQEKPTNQFKVRKNRPGSLGHWCKPCTNAYARLYREKNTPLPDNSVFEAHFSRAGVEYRDVADFPGYRVGNDGTVWSCFKRGGAGKGWHVGEKWSLLTSSAGKKGHMRIALYKGGHSVRKSVHHLVLEAFVGPRQPGMEGCHFPDWNPSNNHVSNLRWDTPQGNWVDRKIHGHARSYSKLTERDVEAIRDLASQGVTKKEIATKFGVSDTQVGNIVQRKQWKEGD